MKWPDSVTLVRHDRSVYNALRDKKKGSELYHRFLAAFEKDSNSDETKALALEVQEMFSLGMGDAETPLEDDEGRQAYDTGVALSSGKTPDVIFVSPYKRTIHTLGHMTRGWPALKGVKTVEDERVREQEHGLALLFNDWRVFHALHPEQRALYKLVGPYWYRYPQGESVSDVRDRNRSWIGAVVRDFAEKDVLVITHHLNILATRANLERLSAEEFLALDDNEKPINCGVTVYKGYPNQGKDGRLVLESYNTKYY